MKLETFIRRMKEMAEKDDCKGCILSSIEEYTGNIICCIDTENKPACEILFDILYKADVEF